MKKLTLSDAGKTGSGRGGQLKNYPWAAVLGHQAALEGIVSSGRRGLYIV